MKKSMKPKRPPAPPVTHPPVLEVQPGSPKPPASMAERHKQAARNGHKGAR